MEDKLISLWRRWEEGEETEERDFDMEVSKKARSLVDKYGIEYDSSKVIPNDNELIENIFEAAIDLIVDVGAHYSNKRGYVADFGEEEVIESLDSGLSNFCVGDDEEKIDHKSRGIEERSDPLIVGGPCGCPVSEKRYRKIIESYAKEDIDLLIGGVLEDYKGLNLDRRSLSEIGAVMDEADLIRNVLREEGKEGLGIVGPMSGVSDTALNSAYHSQGMRKTDLYNVAPLNELKIDKNLLNRLYFLDKNNLTKEVSQCPVIGYLGGPEATAIISVAEIMFDYILGADTAGSSPTTTSSSMGTVREGLWVTATTLLTIKKKFDLILDNWIWAGAGPSTEMLCQEVSAQSIVDTVCGADLIMSAGGTQGSKIDHYTGMEARIAREVSSAAVDLSIGEANTLVKKLLKNYEENVKKDKIPMGKSINQCYSLDKVTPKPEYLETWENTKKYLEQNGLENINK